MEQLLGYTEMTSTLGHLLHFDKDLLPPSGTGSWHLATFLSTGSPSLEDKWEKLTPLTIRPSSVDGQLGCRLSLFLSCQCSSHFRMWFSASSSCL